MIWTKQYPNGEFRTMDTNSATWFDFLIFYFLEKAEDPEHGEAFIEKWRKRKKWLIPLFIILIPFILAFLVVNMKIEGDERK